MGVGNIDIHSAFGLRIGGNMALSFGSANPYIGGVDVALVRDAANTLAQRNGLNPQQFRIYNYTGTNSGEFGKIGWSGNVLQIGTEVGGSGITRALELQTNGVTSLTIPSDGGTTIRKTFDDVALFSGNTSAGILTVLNVTSGTIKLNQEFTSGDLIGTVITGFGNGSGGTGTYLIDATNVRTAVNFASKLRNSGLIVDITDTNAGTWSKIADFRSNGVPRFTVYKDGNIQFGGAIGNTTRLLTTSTNELRFSYLASPTADIRNYTDMVRFVAGNIIVNGSYSFGWGGGAVTESMDVKLWRDAANTLALQNGLNAQQFRVYNYTGTNSGEFGKIGWSNNVLQIGMEAAGSGIARTVSLVSPANVTIAASANTYTFYNNGEGGSPLSWFVPGNGIFRFDTRSRITSPADSTILIRNNAGTDFDRLQFGGTTNAFPSIRRNSADIQIRLADNSAYSTMDAQHRLQGTAPTTPTGSGTAGDMRYDDNYIYICTATNTWKRTPITGGW
jgi:hypothetical protein